ncbi:hypothetical protein [Paludisphaera soli]|uniref:hypothetical protein n=1 Tax=Paludisphaera soli TaxID=2712865 RepID=UPI0013EA4D13|nr:hypothetical protein [Paludisphaera soli]
MPTDIVRRSSSVLRTTKAKDLFRAVAKALGKAEYMGAYGVETMAMHRILRDAPPGYGDLGPYRRVRQVHTTRDFGGDPKARVPFVDACIRLGSERTRMLVRTRGVERGTEGEPDLTVTAGWATLDHTAGPLGVATAAPMCEVDIDERSPGYLDRAYRRDLFAAAAEAMGHPDALRLELADGSLTVSAAEGWRVLLDRADLGDRNPCGVCLFGFEDVRAAMTAGDRVVDRLFKKVRRSSLTVVTSEEEVYESLRGALGELAEGWEVTVVGNLTEEAAAVLAGRDPGQGASPSRLPALVWAKEGAGAGFVVGELVAVERGYALELASQDLPPERLDAAIKAVEATPAKKS